MKLIVESKVKAMIRQTDMQTSAAIFPVLAMHTTHILALAVDIAKKDRRRTVMERDIEKAIQAMMIPKEEPKISQTLDA